jgi:hypothetical protein
MAPKGKILKIGQHMQQKPNANNSDISFKKKQQKVHRDCIIRMQKMKSDTISCRIKNRIGKKMIQVYNHGRQ